MEIDTMQWRGKTSLIKWVTGINSAFFDIRPQPSTDKFMAVVHGDEAWLRSVMWWWWMDDLMTDDGWWCEMLVQEKVINGDAATCLPKLPYSGLFPLWIFLPQQAPWSRQCLRIPIWGWSREHLGYSDTPKYPCKTKMVQKSSLGTLDVPFSSWCLVPMNTLKRRSICIEMYCRWKMVFQVYSLDIPFSRLWLGCPLPFAYLRIATSQTLRFQVFGGGRRDPQADYFHRYARSFIWRQTAHQQRLSVGINWEKGEGE